MLQFTVSPLELFVRGTVIYLVILALMRILRREPGAVGMADLLMLVLIADASQNAMAKEYKSVADGLVLVCTLFFWNYALDWLGFHFSIVDRFIHPQPVALIRNGRLVHQGLRRQLIREDQLQSVLREHGVSNVSDVRLANLEGDGHISVIRYEGEQEESSDETDHRTAL
jgi:uncharacterized membrane protein YcaP (DUF421 family)